MCFLSQGQVSAKKKEFDRQGRESPILSLTLLAPRDRKAEEGRKE